MACRVGCPAAKANKPEPLFWVFTHSCEHRPPAVQRRRIARSYCCSQDRRTIADAMNEVDIVTLQSRIAAIEDSVLQTKIAKAISHLHRAFALYRWAPLSACYRRKASSASVVGSLRFTSLLTRTLLLLHGSICLMQCGAGGIELQWRQGLDHPAAPHPCGSARQQLRKWYCAVTAS